MKFKCETLTVELPKGTELTTEEAKYIAGYLNRALTEALYVLAGDIEVEHINFEPVLEELEVEK